MQIALFSAKPYEKPYFEHARVQLGQEIDYLEPRLTKETAALAGDRPVVCAFVHDVLDGGVLSRLARQGTRLIALRSAGFNNVDLAAAASHQLRVVRVPQYSPYAVAEHTVGLMLALNRKFHRAHAHRFEEHRRHHAAERA